jgi:hypothetical protein
MPHFRPLLALVAFVALTAAGSLAAPTCAYACSCAGPLPGVAAFGGPEEVVLVGRVGPDDGSGRYAFAVERWFHGGTAARITLASAAQRQPDGTVSFNTCGVDLQAGAHLVLVAYRGDGIYSPSMCSPIASVESAEGQAIITDAVKAFGSGVPPGGDGPPAEKADDGPSVYLIAGGIAAVLVLALVVAFSRRERPEAPQP